MIYFLKNHFYLGVFDSARMFAEVENLDKTSYHASQLFISDELSHHTPFFRFDVFSFNLGNYIVYLIGHEAHCSKIKMIS